MRIAAGELDRRITILRAESYDDGTATVQGDPRPVGKRWAKKVDVSDGERMRAEQLGQELTTRFLVRVDSLTRTITGKDQIQFRALGGSTLVFEVIGTKDSLEREDGIEITAVARPDTGASA
ncbi:phage head completion protein [Sphingomonas sanxanigenens]|uniref:Phage head-tail adapter protein n=1 Tax=Sphingomonas sanxanigenens DSM 19645 = NX02 TaxID=1123269 RepID=W0ALG1_9SPHN|nr:head-tail adaptor protein [Sphingomonas sanxanigenens]AHE57427.1 hypothetical protein NX02_29315 [Sphingomonas sanxanigenens DSM 19645 = NX02]